MNLGQLIDGQEAVMAFNKGIQLMIASRENETLQVYLRFYFIHLYMKFSFNVYKYVVMSVRP